MLETLFFGRGCWLGLILGTTKLIGRGLIRPFIADPHDRAITLSLWILMLACFGGGIFYFAGPPAKTETMSYVAGGAIALGLILIIVLGAWGQSLEEIGDEFEDPIEGDGGGGPWSGPR